METSGKGNEFDLADKQKTSGQHYAVPNEDVYITAFHNGNRTEYTRIVAYKIHEDNKKLRAFKDNVITNKYSHACGSAQHIK